MIPLRDDNPTSRPAVVTVAIILACVAAYFLWQPSPFQSDRDDLAFTARHAAIPVEVVERRPETAGEVAQEYGSDSAAYAICDIPASGRLRTDDACVPGKQPWLALVTSLFLHGSVLHLAGNMLFLWVFGNNVEDRLGPVGFAGFYLAGGVIASLAYVVSQPHSPTPVLGASGAVAAVMGAYLVWWPHARVQTLFFVFLVFWFRIPAAVLLVTWFVLQFFTSPNEGVAWVAHVAGFAFGVLVGLLVGKPRRRALTPSWPAPTPYRW